MVYNKQTIPKFNVTDRPKQCSLCIRWFDEHNKVKAVTCSYKVKSKEEALKIMENKRYDLIMNWLKVNKNLVSTASDPIEFI